MGSLVHEGVATKEALDIKLQDEQATQQFATQFAKFVTGPLVIGFRGEIGAGKTTFIRAMLRALGITGAIKSPTYALVESYPLGDWYLHHFDLYRIHEEVELDYIGFRDYFSATSICCIEWSERLQEGLECLDIQVELTIDDPGRALHMQALSPKGCELLTLFSGIKDI